MTTPSRYSGKASGEAGWRWLIPLVPPIGFAATWQSAGTLLVAYAALTAISSMAACLLLFFLRSLKTRTLPLWTVLGLFMVAYYLKFYVALLDPDTVTSSLISNLVGSDPLRPDLILASYCTVVWGFTSFSIAAITCCLWLGPESSHSPSPLRPRNYGSAVNECLIVALAVGIPALVLADKFGLVMGGATRMPFHLNAIISLAEGIAAPMLLIGALDAALKSSNRARIGAATSALAIYTSLTALMTASKGTFLRLALAVAFLWLVAGYSIRRRHMFYFTGMVVVGVLAFSVLGTYRSLVTVGRHAVGSRQAVKAVEIAYSDPGSFSYEVQAILERVVGADIVMGLIDHGTKPLGVDILWRELAGGNSAGVPGALTTRWYGTSAVGGGFVNTLAPSLLGEFYVARGNVGVVAGVACFTLLLTAVWDWLYETSLAARDPIMASLLLVVFVAAEEGTVITALREMIVFVPSAILLEWLYGKPRKT